jgi:hypothetical protein
MREIDPARTDFWQKARRGRKIPDPAGRTMTRSLEMIRKLEDERRDMRSWSAATMVSTLNGKTARTCCVPFGPDFSARTRSRHALRADLSRLCDVARSPIPALTWFEHIF